MQSLIKARIATIAIGFAAHFARILALAPILGAMVIALTMATGLTKLGENTEWLFGPIFGAILPESRQQDFHGGLIEFGLPIAWKHIGLGFWLCLIASIVERFTGTAWRKRLFAFKYWAAGFALYFIAIWFFLLCFHQVEGTFLEALLIFSILIAVLYIASVGGLVAFKIIGWFEQALIQNFDPQSDTAQAPELQDQS